MVQGAQGSAWKACHLQVQPEAGTLAPLSRQRGLPPASRISATNTTAEQMGTALAWWDPYWLGVWGEGRQALLSID